MLLWRQYFLFAAPYPFSPAQAPVCRTLCARGGASVSRAVAKRSVQVSGCVHTVTETVDESEHHCRSIAAVAINPVVPTRRRNLWRHPSSTQQNKGCHAVKDWLVTTVVYDTMASVYKPNCAVPTHRTGNHLSDVARNTGLKNQVL